MIVPEAVTRWRDIVDKHKQTQIRTELILAMIWQESGGDRWAYNPEPRYRWLWNVKTQKPFRSATLEELASKEPPADWPCYAGDPDQEWWAQQASWGLLQLMGAAARERGFLGAYLTELTDPIVNIRLATKHLWVYGYKSGNVSTEAALQRYNGSQAYVKPVIDKMAAIG